MLQKKNSKPLSIQAIDVGKEFFSDLFKENLLHLKEKSEKNVKSQPEINLIFAEEFLKILRILKEKVNKNKKKCFFYFSKKNSSEETLNSAKFIWESTLNDKFQIFNSCFTILLIYF